MKLDLIMDHFRDPERSLLYLDGEDGMVPSGNKRRVMDEPKFLGRVFEGRFNETGNVNVQLILQKEDLKFLFELGKKAKEALKNGEEMPEGTGEYNGEYQIKLEIKQPRDKGKKPYMKLNTYKPGSGGGGKSQKVERMEEEDDMPF